MPHVGRKQNKTSCFRFYPVSRISPRRRHPGFAEFQPAASRFLVFDVGRNFDVVRGAYPAFRMNVVYVKALFRQPYRPAAREFVATTVAPQKWVVWVKPDSVSIFPDRFLQSLEEASYDST